MGVPGSVTANDVTKMLQRHYLPEGRAPGGLFATEVGSPCGRRRADALWLPTTVAGGNGLIGHEIKVSRPDLLVELAEPAKADPWAMYCDRWWIAVSDPALIDGLTIPDAWGVMAPPSGRRTRSMTILQPAPKLDPVDPSPGLRRLVAWQMYNYGARTEHAESQVKRHEDTIERLRSKIDERRDLASPEHTRRITGIIRRTEERIGREHHLWLVDVDDDAVVEALVDFAVARTLAKTVRHDVERLIQETERALEPLIRSREIAAMAMRLGLQEYDERTQSALPLEGAA